MARTDMEQLQFQMSADISKLTKQMEKATAVTSAEAGKIEKRVREVNDNIGKGFGEGLSSATKVLENAFEKAGEKVGELAKEAPGLGAVLSGVMNPALIAAAAAVGGLALAFEGAKQAAESADVLEATAERIGITTDRLQELQHAAQQSDVSSENLQAGLEALNSTFGAFLSGVGDAKVKAVFEAIGISPEQARSLGSVDALLPVLADHIAAIGNKAEEVRIADKLGIGPMLPLLLQGSKGLNQLSEDAHRLGLVVDADLVHQGAEANREFEQMRDLAGAQLHRAFLALVPVAEAVALAIAGVAKAIADLINGVEKMLHLTPKSAFGGAMADYRNALAEVEKARAGQARGGVTADRVAVLQRAADAAYGRLQEANPKAENPDAGIARRLVDPKTPKEKAAKAAPADQTAGFDASAQSALDTATRNLAQAMLGLTVDIAAHAEQEKAVVDADLAKELNRLSAEEVKIRAAKNDTHKAEQLAEVEKARTTTQATAEARKELIARQTIVALATKDLADREAVDRFYDEIDSIAVQMATTAAERRDLELRSLARRKAEEDRARDVARRNEIAMDPANAAAINSRYAALQNSADDANAAGKALIIKQTQGPLDSYLDGLKNIHDEIETRGVQAFQQLNDTIGQSAASILGLKGSLGSFVGGMISLLLQRSEASSGLTSALFGLIPGFASGTNSAPGGLTRYNERGVEGYVPPGAQIVPNDVLRGLARMAVLEGGGRGGDIHVSLAFNSDARGADPAAIARLNASQQALAASVPKIAVDAVRQAQSRTLGR